MVRARELGFRPGSAWDGGSEMADCHCSARPMYIVAVKKVREGVKASKCHWSEKKGILLRGHVSTNGRIPPRPTSKLV